MTDQELLNERRTENVEASKPRWPGSRQSLGSNDHRKRVKASRCSLPRTSSQRKRREHVTDHITRFEEGVKTLQDSDINLLALDDEPVFRYLFCVLRFQARNSVLLCQAECRARDRQTLGFVVALVPNLLQRPISSSHCGAFLSTTRWSSFVSMA